MKFTSKADLTKWALSSKYLWLFLDYDGTLANFAPTPDHIRPDQELIRLLERLVDNASRRVTILSGRRLGHLRQLLPTSGIFLAGTYGIELMTPNGEVIHPVEYKTIRPLLDQIIPRWEEIISGRKGFYLEDKGWAIALHARFADDMQAEQVLARAQEATSIALFTEHFRVLGGHKFLEIAPLLASKGNTVSYLIDHYPLPEARHLCIGDDDKDEEAFAVIHARGGAAVKVIQPSQISRPTEADIFFESPGETRDWLQSLL